MNIYNQYFHFYSIHMQTDVENMNAKKQKILILKVQDLIFDE